MVIDYPPVSDTAEVDTWRNAEYNIFIEWKP